MEKSAIENLWSSAHSFCSLEEAAIEPLTYHKVVSAVHILCDHITKAEDAGIEKKRICEILEKARSIHGRSPFICRLQEWPRGYPGDFETIEYLIRQKVYAPENSLPYYLEYLALNSPIAQQHRNKVHEQAQAIVDLITSSSHSCKILILAAGSSPDLLLVEHLIANYDFEIILNDGDEEALRFSLERLSRIRNRIRTVHGNVLKSAARLDSEGPFDLVVAGGLFDYLPERQACFLLTTIWEKLLGEDGKLLFTNIASGNPYRVWIEYLADWRLIERSERDLRRLVDSANASNAAFTAKLDKTGLTWLTTLE